MKRFAYVIFSRPTPGQEQEYNRWYTDEHLGDVLRVPGVLAAQRFKLAQADAAAPAPYLAVYEIESDDVQRTLAEIAARAGTSDMPISPALDTSSVAALVYQKITERRSRERMSTDH
jgi:hypothetical protein